MNRRNRKHVSFLAIAALVMAQLAISAFACAMPFTSPAVEATPPPCHEGATADDSLCQRHCHDEAQSQAPLAFTASPFVASFVVFLAVQRSDPIAVAVPSRSLLHATSPPLAIANCCLRV